MNNSRLNQSLIELEDNLKNLETARAQVEKVSEKGEKVVIAFNNILSQIETLKDELYEDRISRNERINQGIINFNKKLEDNSDDLLKKSESVNNIFSDSVGESLKRLEEFQNRINDDAHIYQNSIQKGIDSFLSVLDNNSVDVSNLYKNFNSKLSDSINELLKKFNEFHIVLDETIKKVNSIEFERNFKELKNDIENQNIVNKRNLVLSFAIMIVGFLSILITLFLVN